MAAKSKKKKGGLRRFLFAFSAVLLLAGTVLVWTFYRKVFSPNVDTGTRDVKYLYIPTGSDFNDVMRQLEKDGLLENSASFRFTAEQMHYPRKVKPGKYAVKRGMSNRALVTLLRSGEQVPIRITFSNLRTVEELAGAVGGKIEADSASIRFLFREKAWLDKYGMTPENSLCLLVPNTYEFRWNTSAEEFFERMAREYKHFWTDERKQKAERAGFSQAQVCILASIVEKETHKNDEKPLVAGVYINRYRKGWKLEADPTLVFASGDFALRRVLNEHKEIDSPYNTYLYSGLPPGPICMPAVSSIDAVLNFRQHDFMFFCAREDFSGYHNFAKTYSQHLVNARKFQQELNRRGIKS